MSIILQSPIAMLGLLTLLIPLCIHLLSKARPRVIAFAHIAFIKVTTSPLLRQLRLTQIILLGLRMFILLLATLILAQLYWLNTNQQVNSHILLTEDWLNHATDTEKQTLADQVNDSYLVLLSTKNRNINKTELTQWSTNNQQTPALNIWSKVAEYTARLSANEAITVYTTNRLHQFIGSKIPLPEWVEWRVKTMPVENVTQHYSANIKVIYDDSSEPLLVYLCAAFKVINTHKNLSLEIDYIKNSDSKEDSEHLLYYDKIINLSEQNPVQQLSSFNAQWQYTHIPQEELSNIKQADFVLTLARLLYSSQVQVWWLENIRLSSAQITHASPLRDTQLLTSPHKEFPHKTADSTPLHVWLVLLLVAIFILERLLSEWPNRRLKAGLVE